ncbi:MAG: FAD-binding protein, partial [Candidatus Thermoplasmatota archaeon]|nr:FAD-binding protein [Candidatus Thermoplasmatota archaeon]
IPLSPGVAYTTGGAPSDAQGRVLFQGHTTEGLPAELWHTGLYAAGRSAHTGMHGSNALPGNLLLDDLVSGKAAGEHASEWATEIKFGGDTQIEEAVKGESARISSIMSGDGMGVANFHSKLTSAISSGSSEEASLAEVRAIKDTGITLTDTSSIMNTEMVEALRLVGLASVAEVILTSG